MDMSDIWIDRLYILEIVLIGWSYFECGMFFYGLVTSSHQYHPNLCHLLKHLVCQYFVSMACRLVQLYYQFFGAENYGEDQLQSNVVFISASVCRNCLVFIALYFSPFVMLERILASFLIEDYEKKPRRYIGYGISILLWVWSFGTALLFVFEKIPVHFHIVVMITMNVLSLVACFLNETYNSRKFFKKNFSAGNGVAYSLSERYQITENMKTAYLFKRGILSVILFSIICCLFLFGNSSSTLNSSQNWINVGFNYAAILYGIGFPAAMLYYDKKWKRQLIRFIRSLFKSTRTSPSIERKNKLTQKDRSEEANVYFSNLRGDWEKKAHKGGVHHS